jgi:PCO_ADO
MDHPENGVSYERRLVLGLPLLLAGSALSSVRLQAGSFSELTRTCNSLAADLLEKRALNPDEYLLRLASLGAGLDPGDVPKGKLGRFASYDPPIELGPIHREVPIVIIQWKFAPGAVLPPHNHTPGHVLSLCVEGECRVRHFDAIAAPPLDSRETFRVRETENRVLRAGRSTSLTPERDNIHTFEAGPEGALGFDINTFLPGEGDWSTLEIDDRPLQGYERVFEARWIGKPAA